MSAFNQECWYKGVCADIKEGCEQVCPKYLEMKYMMDNSGIPINKQKPIILQPQDCDYEAFCQLAEIKKNIVDFVSDGRSLYITSTNVGNGKTSWSLKLLMKYFEESWEWNGFNVRGVIVHVPTFLMKCKDFKTVDEEFERLKRNLLDVDLVVWDDIASSDISGYDLSQLLMYIDARSFKELSNIYTGNLPSRESLEDALGVRLTSRIWNSRTEVIELKGGDRR